MKKFAILLPALCLASAATLAATTTTTTTTRHTTRVGPDVPTVVTINTHPAKKHVQHRHVVHRVTTVNTHQLGGPGSSTTTTTVRKHSVDYN
ncbi:hypothetical protein HHL11_12160 [Ramlibacter sp. G-1-2-2]|uniref:Secreted protein n=1 Tax=Ramlibacter agri TaxID=2728837 RepID=A0A848H5H9_9BURK|nr:hypothetical protein [Ramlibacter agri]NML44510.1 hypothetical protein [Ramlibacter agri]